jgi:phosphomevalonate kinase
VIATAPGKLIVTGEYAVLDGAPALVLAVNRRVVAMRQRGPRGSSPFLLAVTREIEQRFGADSPTTRAALELVVDSRSFYHFGTKLGLGSSAAVTVAATALALAADNQAVPVVDRELVLAIASAAHANAQGARGARGSGADIASAVYGGVIQFERGTITQLQWPRDIAVLPFFTGAAADTAALVSAVQATRERDRAAVDAALAAVGRASRAACQACAVREPEIAARALLAALALAAHATDQLAEATGIPLVPSSVTAARTAMGRLGGTAKTTGAGGGDVAIAVIPGTEDVTQARRYLIEAGCQPLQIAVDKTGVDLQPDAQ